MTTTATSTAIVVADPTFNDPERYAPAGFLARYRGLTRDAYALDLRQFAIGCEHRQLRLFNIRRADIECFGRDLEAAGRSRATVARRLCTVAGFYRYAVEEELLDHSPAVHVRRPRLDYESHATGLDRNEVGALLVAAKLGPASEHALISLLALNGLRVSEATGANIEAMGLERDHKARSLVWSGDALVDIVGGGASVGLDGAATPRTVNWAYMFDRALVSPSGCFQVLYAALNTKGLVVATESGGVREIDRSYYEAHVYEYPVAVGALPDGREVLVHCPDGYNRLAIEMLAGGERLSAATDKASDVFHSRLQLSPGGRYEV
jgi:hypothetical protein